MTVLTVIAVAAMLTGVAILAVLLVAAQVVDHHARRTTFYDKRPRVADTTGGMAREGTSLNDNS